MEQTPSTHARIALDIDSTPDPVAADASTAARGSLRTRGVGKTVPLPDNALTILDGIDLDIRQGEVLALGSPQEVQSHPGVIEAYLGSTDDLSGLRRKAA